MISIITRIQIEGNDTVSFQNGTNYVQSMSQIMPQIPTYISYGYDSITITQGVAKPFQFSIYQVIQVGGNSFTALTFQDSADDVQKRTIDIYKLLVTVIFKGCCECGSTEPECGIQYTYGTSGVSGQFDYTYGTPGLIRFNDITANSQDFSGLFPLIQDGSWVFLFSKTDPTVYAVIQLSNYVNGGGSAGFDAIELSANGTPFTEGTIFCVDFTSVGGSLVQGWQDTLNINPNLNQDNTVDGGGYNFIFDNNNSFEINTPYGTIENNSSGVSLVAGLQSVTVTGGYIDINTPLIGSASTGWALTLTGAGHVEYTPVGSVTSVDATGLLTTSPNPITSTGTVTSEMNSGFLVGRYSPGVGVFEEVTIGSGLTFSGGTLSADGSVPVYDGNEGIYKNTTLTNDTFQLGYLSEVDSKLTGNKFSQTRHVYTDTFRLDVRGAALSNDGVFYVQNQGTNSFSSGILSVNLATTLSSSSAIEGRGENGKGVIGTTKNSSAYGGQFGTISTTRNTVKDVVNIFSTGLLGGQVGLGGDILYSISNDNNVSFNAGRLGYSATSVTSAANAEAAKFFISTKESGTVQPINRLEVDSTGQLKLNNYTTSTSFASVSGASVGVLNVDNAGNVFVGTGGGGGTGTVTSVDLSVPTPVNPAFSVSGNPITTSGTIAISANGSASDYIDGTGALQAFPTIPAAQGLQDVITTNNNLTTNNTIIGNGYNLTWQNNEQFKIYPQATGFFEVFLGKYPPSESRLYITAIDASMKTKGATTQEFKTDATTLYVKTPAIDAGTAVVGQVLTLGNASTGAVEYTTIGGSGTVTSVGLSVPTPINPAFSVSGSPVTTSGTLAIAANGTSAQYVDGTGALQTFPTIPSGGGLKSGTATQVTSGVYTTTIAGVTSLAAGDTFIIKFDSVNDGASTLNINSLGAYDIFKNTDIKISSGDIKANQEITIVYDGSAFQAIGLVANQLLAYVHNDEGSVITKGQVVYAYQSNGDKMSVKLAKANSDATSAKTVGMVYDSSIAINGEGYIIIQGVIEGINTTAYAAGSTLYLSGTTFGGVTTTKPYAPIHLVYVGIVEKSNAGNGQIYVRCQNGYELDEIHDVDLITTPPVNNDVLVFDTSTTPDLWVAKSIPTILGYTPVTNARTISTTSPLSGGGDLTADRTFSIANAAADGSTKGAAAFTANDFDDNGSGLISIDYTNGQKATASQPGFLTAADWTTFNTKVGSDYFTLRFTIANVSPADNQNYILADITPNLNTTGTLYRVTFPYACKLVGAGIHVINLTSNATTEASTFNFRLNNSTDTLLSNAVVMSGAANTFNVYNITGLSTSIAANDTAQIKWTTPTWVTNPSAAYIFVHCYFERT